MGYGCSCGQSNEWPSGCCSGKWLHQHHHRPTSGKLRHAVAMRASSSNCGEQILEARTCWVRAETPRLPYRQSTRTGCSYGRWLFLEAAGAGNHPGTDQLQRDPRHGQKNPAPRLRREEQRPARGREPSAFEGARPRCGRRGQRCGRIRPRSPVSPFSPLFPARVASWPLLPPSLAPRSPLPRLRWPRGMRGAQEPLRAALGAPPTPGTGWP